MDREALAALAKRVDALRLAAAKKATFARSLTNTPVRHHAAISTALLALVAFVAASVGGEVGLFALNPTCPPIPPHQLATVTLASDASDITIDTDGNMERTVSDERHQPHTVKRRVSPQAVRAIADRLAKGCFFERVPRGMAIADGAMMGLSLRAGDRSASYLDTYPIFPILLCNGPDTLNDIVGAIMNLARE